MSHDTNWGSYYDKRDGAVEADDTCYPYSTYYLRYRRVQDYVIWLPLFLKKLDLV